MVTKDLDVIANWLKHNKLILNVAKTQALLFNRVNGEYKNKELDANHALMMENNTVAFVKSAKLLGCIISNTLSFEQHTIDLCNKARSKTFLLKKCSYLFIQDFNAILFKVLIQSRFDYCSSLFYHFPNKVDAERVERCFNRSVKSLLKINLFNFTLLEQKNMLAKLRILPIKLRSFYHFLTFLFSLIKNNKSSILINKIFSYKKFTSLKNLRKTKRFELPIFNTKIKQKNFLSVRFQLNFLIFFYSIIWKKQYKILKVIYICMYLNYILTP